MTRRGALIAVALLAACSRPAAPNGAGDVPLPADWSFVAPEVRPLVEQAAERCREDPASPARFAALGRLYHGNGAPGLALSAYQRALALDPADARTSYFAGLIHEERGESAEARALFERAARAVSDYAPIHGHLGNVWLDVADPAKAAESFRVAARLDPGEPSYRVGLARALRQAGSLDEARKAAAEALRIAPADPAAHQVAALIEKASGREQTAAEHVARARSYRAGVVRDPWFRDVQALGATVAGELARAEFFVEGGKPEAAVRLLTPLASRYPDRADLHRAIGRAAGLAGQLPRAREAYLRVVEIEPEDGRTRASLASVLLDLGDAAGAVREATAALALDGELSDARIVRAGARLRQGDAAGALADVTPVARSDSAPSLAHLVRGEALMALGRAREAASAFEAALRADPSSSYARQRISEAMAAAEGR